MKKVILIGGGGHCKVVVDAILLSGRFEIVSILDVEEKIGETVCGIKITGSDKELEKIADSGIKYAFICIGGLCNPGARVRINNKLVKLNFELINVIHPSSIVSSLAFLGNGNYIGPKAVVNAGATIGDNCIINTGAIVEHDCVIEDNVHISPGAVIGGGVKIGRNTHLGIGAVSLQNINIGENSLIGAGSVVTGDIEDNIVAYGVPCKKVRNNVHE